MAVTNTRTFVSTRDEIIRRAYRNMGVLAYDGTLDSEQIAEGSDTLNTLVLSWQNQKIFLWELQDDIQVLVANTSEYTLDADILDIHNIQYRKDQSDVRINLVTIADYKNINDKKDTSAQANKVWVDKQREAIKLNLWPAPENTTSIVSNGGVDYLCTNDHTSSSSNEPGTGSDWEDFWEVTTETSLGAWVTATGYKSDVIRYTKILKTQDMTAGNDNPAIPPRYYQALEFGLAYKLSFRYPQADRVGLNIEYQRELKRALDTESETADLIISPM